MSRDAALDSYFEEAASWERDRTAQARRTLRLVAIGAVSGWLAALAAAGALAALAPLKTVEPFLIRVDNTTGVVDVVPRYAGGAAVSEAVTRHLLTHYVQVCERFNFATAESDYEECGAFHTPKRNQEWYARWNPANPASPLNLYKDGTTVRAQVKAVSFFERASGIGDLAQVRYLTARRAAGGTSEEVSHWVATLQYAWVEPSKEPRVRRWNPLGFRVVEFRPEQEIEPDDFLEAGRRASSGAQP